MSISPVLSFKELVDPITMYGGRVNAQQAREMKQKFEELKELVNTSASDHVLLGVVSKKLDLIGEILLGNGHPEDGMVVQVRMLREWQTIVNRIALVLVVPLTLTMVGSVLGFIWLLIIHKATISIP